MLSECLAMGFGAVFSGRREVLRDRRARRLVFTS
jgi:hypothetical protein